MSAQLPVRVLVVDDSTTTRALLVALCSADADLEIVGEACDGRHAVELTKRLRPSIVVMDIDMPVMDGFEATKRIMMDEPTPIMIVTARYDVAAVDFALEAVRAGALTALPKPGGPGTEGFEEKAARFVALVKALADVKVVRSRGARDAAVGGRGAQGLQAVGVAASTGGPAALYRFLEGLPRGVSAPILVVQHIAEGFVPGLVRWLSTAAVLPVCAAQDGVELEPAVVYVAPDDRHLAVSGGRIELRDGAKVGGYRPSASVLFSTLAESYGAGAAAVVLTGMGSDGLTGAGELHRAGGLVLAQDETSSVVFGMPRAVADAGLAHVVGTVDELARVLVRSL